MIPRVLSNALRACFSIYGIFNVYLYQASYGAHIYLPFSSNHFYHFRATFCIENHYILYAYTEFYLHTTPPTSLCRNIHAYLRWWMRWFIYLVVIYLLPWLHIYKIYTRLKLATENPQNN